MRSYEQPIHPVGELRGLRTVSRLTSLGVLDKQVNEHPAGGHPCRDGHASDEFGRVGNRHDAFAFCES
jgi:hypothetical protein